MIVLKIWKFCKSRHIMVMMCYDNISYIFVNDASSNIYILSMVISMDICEMVTLT